MTMRFETKVYAGVKKIPKKKKHGERKRGEGGAPSPCLHRSFGRQARGASRVVRITTQSERTHWSKATTYAGRAISSRNKFAQRI